MSTVRISLQIAGELPPSEKLTHVLGILPTKVLRRGEQISKNRIQPVDAWILDLAKFDTDSTKQEIEEQMLRASVTLQQMGSAIACGSFRCDRISLSP